MEPLTEHPVTKAMDAYYERIREAAPGLLSDDKNPKPEHFYLGVRLRHLLQLDGQAVYHIVGDSTVVYYESEYARRKDGIGRIVLAPDGHHRRIDTVYFDPR